MKTLLKKSKILALVFVLVFTSALSGCVYKGYKGENPELCSIAWASVPTLFGYRSNGEAVYDAEVNILQTDDYGRVLYSYNESRDANTFYLLIMQYKDDLNAHYYDDDCYLFIQLESKDSPLDLTDSEIQALKEANDWGKPIDQSKCTSTQIVTKKPTGNLKLKNDFFEGIIRKHHENSGRYIHPKNLNFVSHFRFFTTDNYGREIITVYTYFEEYTEKSELRYSFVFLVLVNPDKTVNEKAEILLNTVQMQNVSDAVKQLKAQNGWNTPFNS